MEPAALTIRRDPMRIEPLAVRQLEPPALRRQKGAAFTLIELLVVITMIALIASIALPSVVHVFETGADSQAYHLLSAQLAAARALAIRDASYACVHVQLANPEPHPDLANTCWMAVMKYVEDTGSFQLADGYAPRRVPGRIAFGELSDTFADPNDGTYKDLTDGNVVSATGAAPFTTFSIVFGPDGQVVKTIDDDQDVTFQSGDGLFQGSKPLWAVPDDEHGVSGTVMFDLKELLAAPSPGARPEFLGRTGEMLSVNRYTGLAETGR